MVHKPEKGEAALEAKAKLSVSERVSVAALREGADRGHQVFIPRGTKLGSRSVKYLELILPKQKLINRGENMRIFCLL